MYRKVRRTRGIGWNLLMLSICWDMLSDYLTNWSMIPITSLNISLPPGTWILPLYGLYTPLCCLRKSASLANWWSGIMKWCPLMIISNHGGIKSFNSSKNMKLQLHHFCPTSRANSKNMLINCLNEEPYIRASRVANRSPFEDTHFQMNCSYVSFMSSESHVP